MSIATLASDSVSIPARRPSWIPRFLSRAGADVLGRPAKWPFSLGSSQGRPRVLVPAARPEATATEVPTAAVPAVQPQPVSESPAIAGQAASRVPATARLEGLNVHSQSLGTARHALQQDLTVRQMVVDVLLVAMWGALIPGLMWLGAIAGF